MTYEVPTLTKVGNAQEVVRGYIDWGNDLDLQMFLPDYEFLDDEIE